MDNLTKMILVVIILVQSFVIADIKMDIKALSHRIKLQHNP